MLPSKGRNPKKKSGKCGGYTNPPAPGFASKTKQKTLQKSIHDPKNYISLQGSPQEELELLKTLFPPTHKAKDDQNSRSKCIQNISEESYKSHIHTLSNDEIHYKDRYPTVHDLNNSFFKDAFTNPSLNPPVLANQDAICRRRDQCRPITKD